MLKKTASVLAVLALVAAAGVTVANAQTMTLEQAQTQLQTLQALIQQLQGGASAAPAAAVSTTFTRDLTVGKSGEDVGALQQILIDGGYLNIAAPTNYFGALTKKALAAYQKENGITPAAGYFGPKTRNFVAATQVPTPAPSAAPSVSPLPSGSPAPSATPSANINDGSDGSATISYSPAVSSSQTIKKGETKDVYAVKVQATGGKVAVNRFDVHFDHRPWLYFSQVTLKDSSGNVLATKPMTGSADATEVTVDSDYLVRFDGLNTVVTPGTDLTLVVGATVQAATDKIPTNGSATVVVSMPAGSIRTINGKGYTDTSAALSTNSTLTLSGSNSAAALYTRISPNTPVTRIVTTSANQNTNDVVLGVFSLKSQNQDSTISALGILISNSNGSATTTDFQNVRLVDADGNVYGAANLASGKTFTNLNIKLPQDKWIDLTVKADVLSGITGVNASTTLLASTITGTDANYNTPTMVGNNVTSNDTDFLTSGVSVSNEKASLTSSGGTSGTLGTAGFSFTLTNTSNNDVYISKTPALALGTSTAGSAGTPVYASSTLTAVSANSATAAGDTVTAYDIAAGASRTFSYAGSVDNTNGVAGLRVFKITDIYFGSTSALVDATTTATDLNFGLEDLQGSISLQN